MLSSTLAGLSLVWVDAQVREGWPLIPQAPHWRWSLVLFTAVGAGLGVGGYLALLRDLVASPVFPQLLWDFDVRSTKADRAAVGIPVDP